MSITSERERDPLQECVGPRPANGRVTGYDTSLLPVGERDLTIQLTNELAVILARIFPPVPRS